MSLISKNKVKDILDRKQGLIEGDKMVEQKGSNLYPLTTTPKSQQLPAEQLSAKHTEKYKKKKNTSYILPPKKRQATMRLQKGEFGNKTPDKKTRQNPRKTIN